MDRPRADCRDPWRRHLGTYRFAHQQLAAAVPGEEHGRRCPIPAIPWQGRLQRSGVVYVGSGALLCGDRRRDSEFLGTPKTQIEARQAGQARPNPVGPDHYGALSSGSCASSSRSSSSGTAQSSGSGSTNIVVRPILGTAGTIATEGSNPSSACETGEAEASERDYLQQCGRTHKPHRGVDRSALSGPMARTPVLHLVDSRASNRASADGGSRLL